MIEKLKSPLLLRIFFLKKLPLALISGLRLDYFDDTSCKASMRYSWITKNPFKSMYFAAQSMAAEFSTALLAVNAIEKSSKDVAMIITSLNAEFTKKATSRVTFTCLDGQKYIDGVRHCIESGEPVQVEGKAEGLDKTGEVVSVFYVTWSFKLRTKEQLD